MGCFSSKTLESSNEVSNRVAGTILGKPLQDISKLYILEKKEVLGVGGFGTTYKSITKKTLKTKEEKEAVKREIQIMDHVSGQPNIIEIKGFHEDEKFVYIVMELCGGGELFKRIEDMANANSYYSEKKAAGIFKSIVNAVQILHSMGVIHRDLKPENFLFSSKDKEDDVLKAIDFGCSVYIEKGRELKEKVISGLYVAPEVLKGESYGKEIDIWSAGVILYLLLSGEYPFKTDYEIMEARLDSESSQWRSMSECEKPYRANAQKRPKETNLCRKSS